MDDDEPRHGEDTSEDAPQAPENDPDEPGAEGGEHPDAAPLPFAPHEDDDSAFGDTDQHSTA